MLLAAKKMPSAAKKTPSTATKTQSATTKVLSAAKKSGKSRSESTDAFNEFLKSWNSKAKNESDSVCATERAKQALLEAQLRDDEEKRHLEKRDTALTLYHKWKNTISLDERHGGELKILAVKTQ